MKTHTSCELVKVGNPIVSKQACIDCKPINDGSQKLEGHKCKWWDLCWPS